MRLILCFFWISILGAKPFDVEVSARSAILINGSTGAILYEKHPHIPSYPASVTKIATALFILDQKRPPLDQLVEVSAESLKIKPVGQEDEFPAYWGEVDGTRMGLVRGEVLSIESLLYGTMFISGNDAANVLAESVSESGSIPGFMEELNQYVYALGCRNTQFRNPHGLHHPEHFTTAYDMCLIAKEALRNPKFREIVAKLSYVKPKTNRHPAEELLQANPLLKSGKHHYSKAIGVKTGYHSKALYNLVAAAEHEGRMLIAVLLGCPKRTDRYDDAVRLFETAFAEQMVARRFFGPDNVFTKEIPGGKTNLRARLGRDLEISFYPAEEPSCKAFVQWDSVALPIRQGQRVGEVRVLDERNEVLVRGDLLALEEVKGTFWFVLKEFFNITKYQK